MVALDIAVSPRVGLDVLNLGQAGEDADDVGWQVGPAEDHGTRMAG
jgi:hypothetical protein